MKAYTKLIAILKNTPRMGTLGADAVDAIESLQRENAEIKAKHDAEFALGQQFRQRIAELEAQPAQSVPDRKSVQKVAFQVVHEHGQHLVAAMRGFDYDAHNLAALMELFYNAMLTAAPTPKENNNE